MQRAVAESKNKLSEQKAADKVKPQTSTDSKADIPVNLKSLNMEYDVKNGVSIMSGAVTLDDGTMSLQCDKMTVYSLADDKVKGDMKAKSRYTDTRSGKTLDRVLCEKNVVIRKGDQVATAGRAEYFLVEGKIVLDINPVIKDKAGMIKGSRLTYFRDSEKIEISDFDATGNQLKMRELNIPIKP